MGVTVAELVGLLRFKTDARSLSAAMGSTTKLAQHTERGMRRVGSTITRTLKRAAGQLATLAGGAAIVFGVKDALDFDKALSRLDITAKGGLGTLDQLRNKVLEVSDATGINKDSVREATSRYIELTGNVKQAAENMKLFAEVQQSTGATGSDVAGSAAALTEQFKISNDQLEKMFSIVIEGGKEGSAEFKDIAAHLSGLGAAAQKFAGSTGLKAAASLSAALQIVSGSTGGNVAVATTQLQSLMTALGGASSKLKAHGVKVFDASGEYRELAVIFAEMKAKGFSAKQIEDFFPNVRAQRGALALLRAGVDDTGDSWDQLTDKTLASNAHAEDFTKHMSTDAMKVAKAWNTAKNLLVRGFAQVVKGMGWIVDHAQLLSIAVTVLIGLMIAWKAVAIAAAVGTAAAWLVSMAPLILMAVLIAALILLVEDIWVAFKGGKSVTGDAYNWLVDTFVDAIAFWHKQFIAFWNWLKSGFKKTVKEVKSFFSDVTDFTLGTTNRANNKHKSKLAASNKKLWLHELSRFQAKARSIGQGQPTLTPDVSGAGSNQSLTSSVQINVESGAVLDRGAVPAITKAVDSSLQAAARQAETESF